MTHDILLQILDKARWAPSGDNTQPWRFDIVSDEHIAVHGFDTRNHVLYDFYGHPSHMAHGALLETLRIAATSHSLEASWAIRPDTPETAPIYDVRLVPRADLRPDPLLPFIEQRVVQRRPMRTTPLTDSQRQQLIAAAGTDFNLRFFESWKDRLKAAKLLWMNAGIRLTCPEAYPVHRDIIEWRARYSRDRIPDQAVGVDPVTARLMRWVMQSWARVDFFNRYLAGTILPRIQLDFIPALACAAHILVVSKKAPVSLIDFVNAGVAIQRLWLTATSLGLHLQPEMTPVIFRWYVQASKPFSMTAGLNDRAHLLTKVFEDASGTDPSTAFAFFCRVGKSSSVKSRSIRKDLAELTRTFPDEQTPKQ